MPRPNGRDPATNPAAHLGGELRRIRLDAGFESQEALASALGFDRSVIGKAEQGDRPPTDDVLAKWCETCGVPGAVRGMLDRMVVLARSAGGPVPRWFEDWLDAERQAHILRLWSPVLVPGLLQTAEYARALFVGTGVDSETAEEMAAARLARQAILDRPDPPHVVVMLDEPVLHRLIGSPQIMADQLVHIVEVSERLNVSVQVIPSETGANAGLSGAFDLASGDGAPEVLRMEAVEDVTAETRMLVRKAANIFERVRADALPRTASRALIQREIDRWKES